jgi:hypothetical protein
MLPISPTDVERRLREGNPWWQQLFDAAQPPMAWRRRAGYSVLWSLVAGGPRRAVVVVGRERRPVNRPVASTETAPAELDCMPDSSR